MGSNPEKYEYDSEPRCDLKKIEMQALMRAEKEKYEPVEYRPVISDPEKSEPDEYESDGH